MFVSIKELSLLEKNKNYGEFLEKFANETGIIISEEKFIKTVKIKGILSSCKKAFYPEVKIYNEEFSVITKIDHNTSHCKKAYLKKPYKRGDKITSEILYIDIETFFFEDIKNSFSRIENLNGERRRHEMKVFIDQLYLMFPAAAGNLTKAARI